VVSSVSILCQPTVALVDEVVDDRGTREVATEYLDLLRDVNTIFDFFA